MGILDWGGARIRKGLFKTPGMGAVQKIRTRIEKMTAVKRKITNK
jgi:hypothetical protein